MIKWIAMSLSRWDELEADGVPWPIRGPGVGILFVFDTEEEALEHASAAVAVRLGE